MAKFFRVQDNAKVNGEWSIANDGKKLFPDHPATVNISRGFPFMRLEFYRN